MQTPNSKGQLRHYVRPDTPPIRAQAYGCEALLRPEVGLKPWWCRHCCGLNCGKRCHAYPDLRLRGWYSIRADLSRRFPGSKIGGGEKDSPHDVLTGTHGVCIVSSICGQDVQFRENNLPWPTSGHKPSDEAAFVLEPPDLTRDCDFADLLKQMSRIDHVTGSVRGCFSWQRALNPAFRLREESVVTDRIAKPDRVRRVSAPVAAMMVEGYWRVRAGQRDAGMDYRFGTTANCALNMPHPSECSSKMESKMRSSCSCASLRTNLRQARRAVDVDGSNLSGEGMTRDQDLEVTWPARPCPVPPTATHCT